MSYVVELVQRKDDGLADGLRWLLSLEEGGEHPWIWRGGPKMTIAFDPGQLTTDELVHIFAELAKERGRLVDANKFKAAIQPAEAIGAIMRELRARGDGDLSRILLLLENEDKNVRWTAAIECAELFPEARTVLGREAEEPIDWRTYHARAKLKKLAAK